MTLTFNQAMAMIKGATIAIETVRGLIASGKAPVNADGTPLTAADVDAHIEATKAELLQEGDAAAERIRRRHQDDDGA